MKRWVCAALAMGMLWVFAVLLNMTRWAYYNNGVYVLDRWTGRRYHISSPDFPVPLGDTVLTVYMLAGVIAAACWAVTAVARRRADGGDRTPGEKI